MLRALNSPNSRWEILDHAQVTGFLFLGEWNMKKGFARLLKIRRKLMTSGILNDGMSSDEQGLYDRITQFVQSEMNENERNDLELADQRHRLSTLGMKRGGKIKVFPLKNFQSQLASVDALTKV